MKIAPSILACDLANLEIETKSVNKADFLHIDVMDGVFVPNISFGLPVIASLRKKSSMIFDVHLMISSPERYLKEFAAAGADYITIHYESTVDVEGCLKQIKSLGKKSGLSVKPDTPVESILGFLPFVDMILIMTVEPGFGGQKLIDDCLLKVENIRRYRESTVYKFLIEADGGIDESNIEYVRKKGVDVAVMGSSIFRLSASLRNPKIEKYQKL